MKLPTMPSFALALVMAVLSGCSNRPAESNTASTDSAGSIPVSTAAPAATDSPADTAFASMQARGRTAMGIDQYRSTHHFIDSQSGGRIELQSDSGTAEDVRAIREHLRHIATAFAAGDFSDPAFIHMGAVPGSDVMIQMKSSISYRYAELPRGGAVDITTNDPAALKAVHSFLEFQRTAHRTHDMSGSSHSR